MLASLLESCERESRERNLKPLHQVTSLSMQNGLAAALRDTLRGLGYRGHGDLKLARVADWPTTLAQLPLFDAGFGVRAADDEARATLRRNIGLSLEALLGPGTEVWSLESTDSTGVGLMPAGGLSLYFVFESKQARLLLDVCWDS